MYYFEEGSCFANLLSKTLKQIAVIHNVKLSDVLERACHSKTHARKCLSESRANIRRRSDHGIAFATVYVSNTQPTLDYSIETHWSLDEKPTFNCAAADNANILHNTVKGRFVQRNIPSCPRSGLICDGKLLMRGRKLLTLDKAAIIAEVKSRTNRLNQRVPGRRLQTYQT